MKILRDMSCPCRMLALAVLAAALLLASCKSVPAKEEIPEGLSIQELSLKGQSELDRNNHEAAVVYYEVIIERFGSEPRTVTAAEYEIAHIRVKQKHWSEARLLLEKIIARYDAAGGAGLPPEYLVLARNDLQRVIEGEQAVPATSSAPSNEEEDDQSLEPSS